MHCVSHMKDYTAFYTMTHLSRTRSSQKRFSWRPLQPRTRPAELCIRSMGASARCDRLIVRLPQRRQLVFVHGGAGRCRVWICRSLCLSPEAISGLCKGWLADNTCAVQLAVTVTGDLYSMFSSISTRTSQIRHILAMQTTYVICS